MSKFEEMERGLYKEAYRLCIKWWGVPFTGYIEVKNRRWKRTNAQFSPSTCTIKFCSHKNSRRTKEQITKTLLHELVHWRLYTTGVPYRDNDKEFVKEALRVGASFSAVKTAVKAREKYEEYHV